MWRFNRLAGSRPPVARAAMWCSDLAYDRRNREGNTRDEQTVLRPSRRRVQGEPQKPAFISDRPSASHVSIARFVEAR
jgi:hypothetical protein